jgi:hypothetical protein
MPFYHVSGALLESGAGNWGRIIRQIGWQHGRAVHEVALEDQRVCNFPGLPSRFQCAFFFDDLEEARFYKLAQNLHTHLLYEVEPVDPAAIQHRTDWRNISPTGNLDNDWTRRYWAPVFQPPTPTGRLCREILAVTGLRVVTVVT